jgi:hypothetical protein
VTVCDKCGAQEGLSTYEVRQGQKKQRLDLCEAHRKPMEDLLALVTKAATPRATTKKAAAKKTTAGRPRAKSKIMTIEEIEAMKQQKAG